jgi:hypothetical protein
MAAFILVTLLAVGTLIAVAMTVGFEGALPYFAFLVIIMPGEARVYFSDLFVLTTTRAVVVTLLALYFILGRKEPDRDRNTSVPLKYLLILYVGWCLVSTGNSVVLTTSLKAVIDNTLELYLLYFVLAKSISSVRSIQKILAGSIAALVVCCVFGVLERYAHWKAISIFPHVVHRLGEGGPGFIGAGDRVSSTFPHPILFANALTLGIPWVIYLLSFAKTTTQKIYLWVALSLMAWNIYKTSSRGPWLALAMSLVALFIFSQGSTRKYLVVVAVLIAATLILRPGVTESLRNIYVDTENPDSPRGASYQYRYELMGAGKRALAASLSRSLWGFGPESFYYLGLESEVAFTGKTEVLESCDSAWVAITVELGYVGLLLVASLLGSAAFLSFKGYMALPRPGKDLCMLLLINLGAYSFMMVSVANFGWGQQSFMLWMVMAMSVVAPRLAAAEVVPKQEAVSGLALSRGKLIEVAPG